MNGDRAPIALPGPRRRAAVAALAFLAIAIAAGAAAAAPPAAPAADAESRLRPDHAEWLDTVALLISEEERAGFLALPRDYQRDAFIRRFWQLRDPFPDTARNEFRERWELAAAMAREQFQDLREERSEVLLLAGPPTRVEKPRCRSGVKPLEIWFYAGSPQIRGEFFVVFQQPAGNRQGRYRRWSPGEGLASLLSGSVFDLEPGDRGAARVLVEECVDGSDVLGALATAADWERLRQRVELVPKVGGEWLRAFAARSTEVPEGAAPLPATLELRYPGRHQSRTVLEAIVSIGEDAPNGAPAPSGDRLFVVDGEVLREGELFESFRYRFESPAAAGGAAHQPLVVQRYLRPGAYELVLKVEDVAGRRFFREQRPIEVPLVAFGPPPAPPAAADDTAPPISLAARDLREATAALPAGDHGIRLFAPGTGLATGRLRVEATTSGEGVARVEFSLNGRRVLTKGRPPWSVEIDLGKSPRTHRLRAAALSLDGRELASDEVLVNAGAQSFRVRLLQPQRGQRYESSLRAEAEVDVPAGEALERVEIYLNEDRVATLYQPPFAQPMILPPGREIAYVRAVAYLDDGASTEDLVFVNAPDNVEEIRVRMVELFATVVDRRGRPVEGLEAADFSVSEDGEPQTLVRFERVRDLPIHAGILLDTSTSMAEELGETVRAGLRFFETVLEPKDRACVITFADQPTLAVPFTNNPGVLAGGVAHLVADGETALWDSLVFALHYFSGLSKKRALVVLTDGVDSRSRYTFDDALDFAKRTGVALYPIGLRLPQRDMESRTKLARLAEETGGRSFMIQGVTELERVYRELEEELRSQYLLVYQSPQSEGEKFREIEVRLGKPGLEAKTIRGYYP